MRRLLQATWVAHFIAAVIALNGFLNLATGLISVFGVRADLGLDKVPEEPRALTIYPPMSYPA